MEDDVEKVPASAKEISRTPQRRNEHGCSIGQNRQPLLQTTTLLAKIKTSIVYHLAPRRGAGWSVFTSLQKQRI